MKKIRDLGSGIALLRVYMSIEELYPRPGEKIHISVLKENLQRMGIAADKDELVFTLKQIIGEPGMVELKLLREKEFLLVRKDKTIDLNADEALQTLLQQVFAVIKERYPSPGQIINILLLKEILHQKDIQMEDDEIVHIIEIILRTSGYLRVELTSPDETLVIMTEDNSH